MPKYKLISQYDGHLLKGILYIWNVRWDFNNGENVYVGRLEKIQTALWCSQLCKTEIDIWKCPRKMKMTCGVGEGAFSKASLQLLYCFDNWNSSSRLETERYREIVLVVESTFPGTISALFTTSLVIKRVGGNVSLVRAALFLGWGPSLLPACGLFFLF